MASHHSSSEEEPFLGVDEKQHPQKPCDRCKRSISRTTGYFVALQVILIILYTSITAYIIRQSTIPTSNTNITPSLSSNPETVDASDTPNGLSGLRSQYEHRKFVAFQDSPFTGTPGGSIDEAWKELLDNMTIRVTKEELERGNQTSVALPNGGYMAWLGVYHELHCVKYLREYKYADYYFPYLSEEERRHKDIHADHCLEMLRSAAMCRADTSLTTFQWETQRRPMLDLKRPIHTCVNWESFVESFSDRIVSEEEGAQLVNPNLIEGHTPSDAD